MLGDAIASEDARDGHKQQVRKRHLFFAKQRDSATVSVKLVLILHFVHSRSYVVAQIMTEVGVQYYATI